MTYLVEPSWLWHDPEKCPDGTPRNGWRYTERRIDQESRSALYRNVADLPCVILPCPSRDVDYQGSLFQFVFIDGDHTEGGIDVDCEKFLPWLTRGGLVAFHDYGTPDYPFLKRTVDEATKGWPTLAYRGSVLVKVKP